MYNPNIQFSLSQNFTITDQLAYVYLLYFKQLHLISKLIGFEIK